VTEKRAPAGRDEIAGVVRFAADVYAAVAEAWRAVFPVEAVPAIGAGRSWRPWRPGERLACLEDGEARGDAGELVVEALERTDTEDERPDEAADRGRKMFGEDVRPHE